jgi:hypothetical protein
MCYLLLNLIVTSAGLDWRYIITSQLELHTSRIVLPLVLYDWVNSVFFFSYVSLHSSNICLTLLSFVEKDLMSDTSHHRLKALPSPCLDGLLSHLLGPVFYSYGTQLYLHISN